MARRGRGEGTIYKRADGLWEAKVEAGVDDHGKRRRRSLYAKRRRTLQTKIEALRRGVEKGAAAEGTGETVGAFLALGRRRAGARVHTPALRAERRAPLTPALGRIPLAALTAEHVNALQQAKLRAGLSPRSVHHVRAVLRNALGRAVRWNLITRNVAELADPPKVPEYEARFLTIAEARAFLEAARGDRLEPLYSVALSLATLTAWRRRDVVGSSAVW